MRRLLRVAAVQFTSTADVADNLARVLRFIGEASARHNRVVAFPENTLFLGAANGRELAIPVALHAAAQPAPALEAVCAAAKSGDIAVLLPVLEREEDAVYNTAVWISRAGIVEQRYRKIHLFDYGALQESRTIRAGTTLSVFDAEGARMGLSICFDVRFPLLYQELMQRGANVVFVPSAFTPTTGAAHWVALLRARAIEVTAGWRACSFFITRIPTDASLRSGARAVGRTQRDARIAWRNAHRGPLGHRGGVRVAARVSGGGRAGFGPAGGRARADAAAGHAPQRVLSLRHRRRPPPPLLPPRPGWWADRRLGLHDKSTPASPPAPPCIAP